MDGDGSTGGHADGAGGFADGAGGFADGAGGLGDVAATAAAVASAAQPLPPSLSHNVAATGLRVSWHDCRRSGGGRAVCRLSRRTICVLCPGHDCWRRTAAVAVWLGWRRRR